MKLPLIIIKLFDKNVTFIIEEIPNKNLPVK